MANIIITNNGHADEVPAVPADDENGIPFQPAIPADKNLIISAEGFEKILAPGECVGLDPTLVYLVKFQE